MKYGAQAAVQLVPEAKKDARLNLVVPFTTPKLTHIALDAASRLGHELDSRIRLLKIQVVPYPLELAESPVALEFLKRQLKRVCRGQAGTNSLVLCEIRMAREFVTGLCDAITQGSVVILATQRRPWRTRTERLYACLKKAGHTVILINSRPNLGFREALKP